MNDITSLTNTFVSDLKSLNHSFDFASEAIKHLETKKEWGFEEWLYLIAAGAYVGYSGVKTYQGGKALIEAFTTPQPVANTPIPIFGYNPYYIFNLTNVTISGIPVRVKSRRLRKSSPVVKRKKIRIA